MPLLPQKALCGVTLSFEKLLQWLGGLHRPLRASRRRTDAGECQGVGALGTGVYNVSKRPSAFTIKNNLKKL